MMTIKAATTIAGSLGYPSKMPGTSYGIPASACITGSILAAVEGSTCSGCYAMKGNYLYPSVVIAQERRLVGINHELWIDAMVTLLCNAHCNGEGGKHKGVALALFHRWHDSGDIQSRDHLAKICAVARLTPWLQHWLPTREGKIVREFVRDGGVVPPNLCIRLSATMVDGAPPKAWPQTSTVHSGKPYMVEGALHFHDATGQACPAPTQGNKCGPCRACWDTTVANVSYHIH